MAQFAAFFGGYGGRGDGRDRGNNPIALLATLILAPLAAVVIQMWISRTREYAADAGGAQIAGNPYGLVEALKKIDAVSKRVPLDANPATAHMSAKSFVVDAPSRKSPKIAPMYHGSRPRMVFTDDHPATFSKTPRGIAIVTFAQIPSRFVLSGGTE